MPETCFILSPGSSKYYMRQMEFVSEEMETQMLNKVVRGSVSVMRTKIICDGDGSFSSDVYRYFMDPPKRKLWE